MSGGSLNPLNVVQKLGDAATSFVGSVGKGLDKAVSGIGKTVDNILKNPLPVIETVALTYVLGPAGAGLSSATAAAVSSAAVSAANGGKIEDIALNAAAAYGGGQLGEAAGSQAGSAAQAAEMSAAEQAMIKQVVTSSSASAATVALRGGDLNQILAAGVTGGVNGYVRDALAAQGFTQADNKLISNAVSSATNAILKGKSISEAIGQSLAATTISSTLQGKVDQVNKNNELGSGLADQFTSMKEKADAYFTESVKPLQDTAQADYTAAKAAMDKYNATRVAFDAAISDYNSNKDGYVNYTPATYDEEGKFVSGSTASQDDYLKAANAAAAKANELAAQLPDLATTAQDNAAKYAGSLAALEPYQTEYNTTYITPLKDINTQIEALNTQQASLATDIGQTTAQYQDQLKLDAADLQKQIDDKAAADLAAQQVERQKALESGDWKTAYGLDKLGVDAKEFGITDTNWKDNQQKLQDLYILQGGVPEGWQQVGSDKVRVYADGTGMGVNENGEAYNLTPTQIDNMIWNQQISREGTAYDPTTPQPSAGTTASGMPSLPSTATGTTPKPAQKPTTVTRPATTPALPAATQTALANAAQQTNAMGILSLLGAMDSGNQQPEQPTVAPDAQVFDWSAPLETNPFKQNPTTDVSGATKMARGGSIDDLVALLKRG